MARSYFTRNKKTYWRINESIQAPSLRVVGPEGRQLGVFSSREANDKAREMGMDLVEIAPKANPPVAKIIDFVKFKYQQEKKEKEQKLEKRWQHRAATTWFWYYFVNNREPEPGRKMLINKNLREIGSRTLSPKVC